MRNAYFWLLGALLAMMAGSAQASCRFSQTSQTFSLPAIDPSLAGGTITATTLAFFTCDVGSVPSWTVIGANGATTNPYSLQLISGSVTYSMPYSVTTTRISLGGNNNVLVVQASVIQADYVDAYAGNYVDRLTLSILP
jgi:hypothetical protein